jgi:hypothetical protein
MEGITGMFDDDGYPFVTPSTFDESRLYVETKNTKRRPGAKRRPSKRYVTMYEYVYSIGKEHHRELAELRTKPPKNPTPLEIFEHSNFMMRVSNAAGKVLDAFKSEEERKESTKNNSKRARQ